MGTILYSPMSGLAHDTGPRHPECIERLQAVFDALDGPEFSSLDRRDAPAATTDQIALAHDIEHVERLLASFPEEGLVHLDPDTVVSPGSKEAVLRGAGATCAAVDAVLAGDARTAFCAVRPPGHHAEPDRAMGFCIFNNVAIGALHARMKHGVEKIAVIDFDVHHGNGTQAIFENDSNLFYGSTHQSPFYPGTGARGERGIANNVVNLPLAANSGSKEFRKAMADTLLPALADFDPDLIMISAGFDAHLEDPLGQLELLDADFVWVTERLCEVAAGCSGGRMVSTLEGGYSLDVLGRCVADHVAVLMNA
jgi:acetoin utilization deacetylase AcuC-like enzyme